VLAFASGLYADRKILFWISPDTAARTIYGDVPFPQAETIGRFIRENSSGATCWRPRLGAGNPILRTSHLRDRYIYTYPLMENQIYAPQIESRIRSTKLRRLNRNFSFQ